MQEAMDQSITMLSPISSPSSRQKSRWSSTNTYRTPRSEGFPKQKVILDTPNSSEYSFATQRADVDTVLTPNSSFNCDDSTEKCISGNKFYSKRRTNLLPLFERSETEARKNDVRTVSRETNNRTPKRKRSKSLDHRSRSKIVKLSKNVRHGIRRPKPKKTPGKGHSSPKNERSDADREILQTTPIASQVPEARDRESISLVSSPCELKQKEKKEISVKVNKMVRMNLQCGEIKFTKSTFSPMKTQVKKSTETFDELAEPEADYWLKSKVDNILNSLDEDPIEATCNQQSGHKEDKFNDSSGPLSVAFHDFGMKELQEEDAVKKSLEKEKSLLFADWMEVPLENNRNDVLSEKAVNSDETNIITPSKKLFPIFYRDVHGPSKENVKSGDKLARESSKFMPRKISDGMEQLIIDAGQKSLAPSTCSECGFFYQKGDADEEKMHRMYHGSGKPGIKHLGWKWERVAVKYPEGRVIRVCPGDPKTWWSKVDIVLEKANDDLGITFTSKLPKNAQAYMFVGDGYILGCVIAEPIRVAYRMLESDRKEAESVEVDENKSFEIPKVPSFCSNTPVRGSRCGINRMWTCASERRKGIATKILDAIRATFVYGHILRLDELAFSDPTPLGMSFAQKYTKTASILVYKPSCDSVTKVN